MLSTVVLGLSDRALPASSLLRLRREMACLVNRPLRGLNASFVLRLGSAFASAAIFVCSSAAPAVAQSSTCFFGQVRTIGLPSEPGGQQPLGDATVTLYLNGSPYLTATTNASGIYSFAFSAPGGNNHWYTRAVKAGGWVQVNHTSTWNTNPDDFCSNGGLGFGPIEMAKISVKEIGFKNDYTIKTWAHGTTVNQDFLDIPDGSASTWSRDNPFTRLPVAYSQGSSPTMFAIVEITPATFYGNWAATLRARVGGQVVATEEFNLSVGFPGAARPGLIDDIASSALDTGVGKKTYTIEWDVLGDSVGLPTAVWQPIETATQTVYWTAGPPAGGTAFSNMNGDLYPELYDRALDWACGSVCGGVSNAPEIIPASLTLVTDPDAIIRAINLAIDKATYYHPSVEHNTVHPLQETNSLDKRGQCSDNANLLVGLLHSIGIEAQAEFYYAVNPVNSNWFQYTYVRRLNRSTAEDCISIGCPQRVSFEVQRAAHDLAPPNPHFTFHCIVTSNGRRWDPSYGLDFIDPIDFDEAINPATATFASGSAANAFRTIASSLPSSAFSFTSNPICPHSLNAVAVAPPTVPTTMIAGQTYVVTVTMRNTGTEPWTAGDFGLVSDNPINNSTWGQSLVPYSGAPPIGQNGVWPFVFTVTAPTSPGSYDFQWRMSAYSNQVWWFGSPSANVVVIVVSAPTP